MSISKNRPKDNSADDSALSLSSVESAQQLEPEAFGGLISKACCVDGRMRPRTGLDRRERVIKPVS
jgi:hypothetical protein